ncbi:hypothetical protein CHLRE_06g254175v5 [Chlamydomonas reinhardtii]|uniref:MTP0796m n=1 Tax=Chlamydomonas reinhardtii TaxID=3055 RepID=D5LAX6_CHLRE|nr:uncharacterized protein CHLRE_06g254175v5 [Chlamydomonas reinhardtii]ADF43156.1 MTP0796p [Chlamydomonas reinhardtii]ADF43198.1 MTP0796m [Chlamydomonas reinhardtii]PNW81638.1 hypothetical protein CHLRE_06g254175v5 [Chlamydomonas reinhardtii]
MADGAWDELNDEDFQHEGAVGDAAGANVGGAPEGVAAEGAAAAAEGFAADAAADAAGNVPAPLDAAALRLLIQQAAAAVAAAHANGAIVIPPLAPAVMAPAAAPRCINHQCESCHFQRVVHAWMVWSLPWLAAAVLGGGMRCVGDD